jgi:hypothetical protein
VWNMGRGHVGQEDGPRLRLWFVSFADLWVLMDVAESPELDPHSPEDEEQPALSDDDILRESGSEQDLDGAGERASDLEEEENATRVQSQEETRSDEEDRASEPKSQDQDSEAHELSRGPAGSPCEEGDDVEEDGTSDLRDEASSVTRELDEHELDYDEEVPEEPAPAAQEEEAEKAGAEEEEEKGEGAPGEEGKPDVQSVGEQEPTEAAKEKKKEDDDGEIDDGEIDVSMVELSRATCLIQKKRAQQDSQAPLFLERGSVVGWARVQGNESLCGGRKASAHSVEWEVGFCREPQRGELSGHLLRFRFKRRSHL